MKIQTIDLGQGYGKMKAITSIPGWAELLNQQLLKGQSDGPYLYKNSVWANRCVNIKADALAGIPWGFVDGNDEPVERPNIARILDEASDEANWSDMLRGTGADLDIYGEAYWEKLGETSVVGLNRINASTMKPVINKGGEIVGFQQDVNGKKVDFEREQVIYFHTYNPDNDLIGLSLLEVAANAILSEINANEYLAAFFANSAIPPVVFYTEQVASEQDMSRLRRWWDRTFKGAKNQHKVAMMDRGLKPHTLGYPVKDLALKEIREEARRDIASALGVPPALAGAWEAANYAASNEQRQSFYTETIIPRAEYMASVLNAELIQQLDAGIRFGFKYKDLDVMQPDMESERRSIAELVAKGVITPLAGARQLGYEDDEAGIGPIVTRVIDEDADISPGAGLQNGRSALAADLAKWQKKSLNSISKKKGAQVDFESEHIPKIVNEVLFGQLGKAQNKDDVQAIFEGYLT